MTLDFYFDYLSPYAYLASREIFAVCARHEVELQLRPVLFAGLLGHWGQRGPAEIPPKAVHTIKECKRYALLRNIPLCPPRHHPFKPLTALRASLFEVAGQDQALVIRTIFDLGWVRGGDIGDPKELAKALTAAGLGGSRIIEAAGSEQAKESLRRETELAVGRGVFGIPTMIVRDELFWGLDQLRYLELFLEGKDPLANVDFDDFDFRGPSAWRTGVSRHGKEG
ncbi:MAG: 2-hydroxychromene-2-carboxylate isomerase [bacterium]|nr:2-hydroxychromene-2-carboxylate isomerase [bacterium]